MSVISLAFYAEATPNSALLGTLTEDDFDISRGEALEFRPALHDLGGIKLTVSRHNTAATSTLIRENNIVKVTIPSVSASPIWAGLLKEGNFTLIDRNEQGGELLTFEGPGLIYMLSFARLGFTPYAPDQPARGSLDRDGQWTWINEPYGAVLTRIIEEGQEMPGSPLADVTIDFDRVLDSDGIAWPTITEEFITPIGSDVLSVTERLVVAGDLYLVMDPDLSLHAYQASYGRNLAGAFGAGTVRFEKGVNILTQLKRKIAARDMLTHLIQQDSERAYSSEVMPGFTGRAHYGYFEAGQTNDDTQLNKIAQNVIAASRTSGHAHELEVTPGFVPASGTYMPGPEGTSGHFWVGDTVTLHTGTGTHDFNAAAQIVVAIRIVLDEAAVDTTAATSALSLHIVPELNYQEVRGFSGGVSPAALGVPGFCCGPPASDPTVVGDPPTILDTWTWSNGPLTGGGFGNYNQAVVAFGAPLSQGAFTMTNGLNNREAWFRSIASGDFLPQNGGDKYLPCVVGTDINFAASVGPRNMGSTETRVCKVRYYTGVAGGQVGADVTLLNDTGSGFSSVTATLTPPATATVWRIYIAGSIDNVVMSTGAGVAAQNPLSGTAICFSRCDHTHAVVSAVAPTPDDDAGSGFPMGTIMVNDGVVYVSVDSTDGVAEWVPVVGSHEAIPDAHLQANLAATAAPSATDDSSEGYGVGSIWVNTTTDTAYIATDVAVGAANWMVAGGTAGVSLGWFNVKDYGATGDGTTDDLASINDAIAALNAATGGVLYFPEGNYLVSAGLTTISVAATIMGDGITSKITSSSTTAVVFTLTATGTIVRDLYGQQSGTATAGAFIRTTGGGITNRYERLRIWSFWVGIDHQDGYDWSVEECYFDGIVKYAVKITNANPDEGDWSLEGNLFSTSASADAAVRVESSGGGRISNNKVNGSAGTGYAWAVDYAWASGNSAISLITGNSFENTRTGGIRMVMSGGSYKGVAIVGNQFGFWSGSGQLPITLSTSGAGVLSQVVIDNIIALGAMATYVVTLTGITDATVSKIEDDGFTGKLSVSGGTNITDNTAAGGASDHGALTGLADDDHTQYVLHTELTTAGHYELIVSGSAPPVASTNEAADDFVYGWVST